MEKLLAVKIGGNIIDDEAALQSFLTGFASIPGHKIMVHGGGKLATDLSTRLGVPTTMIEGRRVTDNETIQIVTMAYAGWINKNITARLQASGCNAIGLCGADGRIVPAVKRPVGDIDYGWVGDIQQQDIKSCFLSNLLQQGITPVIAPITCNTTGNLLNINADTMAQSLALALSTNYNTTLIYCFEKSGLLANAEDDTSVLKQVSHTQAQALKHNGIITHGMVPKIDNAFTALAGGVQNVVIGHASFIQQMACGQKEYGTHLTK